MAKIIAAVGADGIIGCRDGLPWKSSADLRFFAQQTKGHVVVMGRRTWETIGKVLPDRENVVISKSLSHTPMPCPVLEEFSQVIAGYKTLFPEKTIWVIGGAQLYADAIPFVDEMIFTLIPDEYLFRDIVDPVYFPSINFLEWDLSEISSHPFDSKLVVWTYRRRNK